MRKNRRDMAAVGLTIAAALSATSAFAGTVFSTYSIARGDSARVEFNNGVFTPVDVQVSGTWRSN